MIMSPAGRKRITLNLSTCILFSVDCVLYIYIYIYLSDRDMFCAGRVQDQDLKRTMHACGGSIQTTTASLTDDVLGMCETFEEKQVGGDRYVLCYVGALSYTFYI